MLVVVGRQLLRLDSYVVFTIIIASFPTMYNYALYVTVTDFAVKLLKFTLNM